VARAMIGLDRHSLLPVSLEAHLFLKVNQACWSVHDDPVEVYQFGLVLGSPNTSDFRALIELIF
jgi:hypothetical protein